MSQNEILLAALLRGESITPARAFELCGSYACHSRIADLRAQGHAIDCRMESNGRRRWGVYTMRGQLALPIAA